MYVIQVIIINILAITYIIAIIIAITEANYQVYNNVGFIVFYEDYEKKM